MQKSRLLQSVTVPLASIILLSPVFFQNTSSSPLHSVPADHTLSIVLNCSDTNGIIRSFEEIDDGPAPVKPVVYGR